MTSINGVAKWNGLVFGETRLFVAQIIGIFVSIAVAVVGSLICIAIVRIFTPLRVEEEPRKSDWMYQNMEKMLIQALTV